MLSQENVTVLCILSVHILDIFSSLYTMFYHMFCHAFSISCALGDASVHLVATQGSFCTRFDKEGISDYRNWSLFGEVESARVFFNFFGVYI